MKKARPTISRITLSGDTEKFQQIEFINNRLNNDIFNFEIQQDMVQPSS